MKYEQLFAFLLSFSFLPIIQGQLPAANPGMIEGTLSYPDGNPAPGFMLTLIGTSLTSVHNQDTRTNNKGQFKVAHLSLGSYALTSYLDTVDSHYPPGDGDFFDKHLYRITLSAEHPDAKVALQLDLPSLIISGTVTDLETGKPIIATIWMWQTIDPKNKWLRTGSAYTGVYHCWLPPNKTILLRASAPGYRDYETTIPAITNGVDPVLNIAMQPLPVQPAKPLQ